MSNTFTEFKEKENAKLLRKYNLRYDLYSLVIVMEVRDELSLIEKIMLKKLKQDKKYIPKRKYK